MDTLTCSISFEHVLLRVIFWELLLLLYVFTASIGLSVRPSIGSFILSHPHRPTHSRHHCLLPHNSHKRRTCHPVTPHYNLLHTCYTLSLPCYTPVTHSYTPCQGLFINHIITFWGYLDAPSPLSSCHLLATPPPPLWANRLSNEKCKIKNKALKNSGR